MTENDFFNALKEARRRAGTQQRLADSVGLTQSTLAGYFCGRYSIGNMTVTTLLKLFPNMSIDFFGGRTGDETSDEVRTELLAIFDSLDPADRVHLLALAAANFGSKLKNSNEKE